VDQYYKGFLEKKKYKPRHDNQPFHHPHQAKENMATFDPGAPPLISETLLKSRRTLEELAHKRSVTVKNQNQRRRVVRGEDVRIKRPEQFVREARIKEGSKNKMLRRKREAEKRRAPKVPKNSIKTTVGFVIRIHAGRHTNNDIKAELRKLNLNHKYDGVFMKLDEAAITHLKAFDAYVAYGYVTNKSVMDLLQRRAFAVVGGTRKPLSDNLTVEEALGDKGILCLSDLAHEIYNVGPGFNDATKILSTFKLSAPIGTYEKKVLNVHDEVEEKGGFIGDGMEEFLAKIL